jgi:FKBP-type peptidyl-prolyl cis-trans isomerase FkpA
MHVTNVWRAQALLAALLLMGCPAKSTDTGKSSGPLASEEEKTLYALGASMGQRLKSFNLSPSEVEIVKRGLGDAVSGAKLEVELDQYGPKIGELARSRNEARSAGEKAKGKEYQNKAAQEQGAVKTDSGLIYKELTAGNGGQPVATDTVKVNYRGTLIDGTEFDSSYKRNQPAEFPLNRVIPCWTEGLQKMKVGSKARLVCPSTIAYGDNGQPPNIPGGATLVFEVELLEIVKK